MPENKLTPPLRNPESATEQRRGNDQKKIVRYEI